MIEVFQPSLGPEEEAAVLEVIRSGWIGFGPKVIGVEQGWARLIGVPRDQVYAVACATDGLFQICEDIAQDSYEIILPANVFIGFANAAHAAGLRPVFCDVDPRTLNPRLEDLERVRTQWTRAVGLQHFGGVPTDLDRIADWCQEAELLLVEDCACAPGASDAGAVAGTVGDYAVWSFDAMKIITGGDGGLVRVSNSKSLERMRRGARLGQSTLSGRGAAPQAPWWEFTAVLPGRRSLMNDLQAAMIQVQIGKLQTILRARQWAWDYYQRELAGIPEIALPPEPGPGVRSAYYCYWITCQRREELAEYLRDRGIYTTYRYWPAPLAYRQPCPFNALASAHYHLLLPLHANLTEPDLQKVVQEVRNFYSKEADASRSG